MNNDELAIKIEDELKREDRENGEPEGDYFANIMNWLEEFAEDAHDYDETDIAYLKSEFEMATF